MLILASSSPRRREMLQNLNLDFKIISSDIDENIDKSNPKIFAMSLAFQKAFDVASKNSCDIVIAADTIVVKDNEILGKPNDREDAFEMLKKLSGQYHEVITGICILNIKENKKIVDYEITRVKMKNFSESKITRYINTNEPMDKAGSYGIQGFGCLLVDKIEGDFFNVVGLPLGKLDHILSTHFKIEIF